jgi:hypothetical protein
MLILVVYCLGVSSETIVSVSLSNLKLKVSGIGLINLFKVILLLVLEGKETVEKVARVQVSCGHANKFANTVPVAARRRS